MDFTYSDDQRVMRDGIRRFARNTLNEDVGGRDEREEFSRELWDRCGEMGLTGLPVPETHGGPGFDPLTTAMALEAFSHGCEDGGLVFSVCAHLLACVVPIWMHGSDALKDRYLPGLVAGKHIATNAMTETGAGSDAFHMTTSATRTDGGYLLNGTKMMCTNGPVADVVVTYAVTDPEKGAHGGITAFVLDATTPGISKGQRFPKMGLRTSPFGEVIFEDVLAPDDNAIGGIGGGTTVFNQSMEWERICVAAAHVGTMERLLEIAIAYARTRKSGGKAIGKNQAISHKIADMKARLETSRLLAYQSATRLGKSRTVGMDASMTKVYVSEALIRSAQDTVQILGGHGYLRETGVERILRDAHGGTLYSGTNEVQRNIVAAWLGL